jgi:N-acetylneuraminate synthase/N,N'-diacetyllegionaminate synthase
MTSSLTIGNRAISPASPTLIIAEIGVNHDGSTERALELVHLAASAGADAVKLQIFRADTLMHPSSAFAAYQRERVTDADPIEMLRRYELSDMAIEKIVAAIRASGLIPIATPFSPGDVDIIERLDLPAIKIASPDIVNLPLLRCVARTRKPLLVSTGAATMDEVRRSAQWLTDLHVPFVLLHCTSSYPVAADDANLCWIAELAAGFAVPIGFSDHTTDVTCGALAVAAGACIIEKHLTYDCTATGPDHSASADPRTFAQYISVIRSAEILRGRPGKRVLSAEQDVRTVSRQSLVLRQAMAAGGTIVESSLTVQRPGTGIPAAQIDAVLGRRLRQPLPAGTLLQWEMLSPSGPLRFD